MADAACGPSNALQNFQKHSTVDRTLQQDRLVSRRAQAENFRSEQGRNAGVLDPEFEAFQAGHPPVLDHDLVQHNLNFGAPQPPPPAQFAPHPAAAGWANDFQKLRISQPPQPAAQLHNRGNMSWHQEFQRQQQQAPVISQPQQFVPQFSNMGMQRPMGYMPMSSYQQPVADAQWKGKENLPMDNQIDEAALDREFERIASEALQNEAFRTETAEAIVPQSVAQMASGGIHNHDEQLGEVERLDFEGRPEQEVLPEQDLSQAKEQNVLEPIEDDGLAEPAGRLLEHVADNTTDKFQNSQFLELMRRLRDRETVLKGEEFVDTAKALHVDELAQVYQREEENRVHAQEKHTGYIPPEEQDADLGRNVRMNGALPPMNDSGYPDLDRPLPLDPSFRHRHLVDDF